MKFLFYLLVFTFLAVPVYPQFQQVCKFCTGEFRIPTMWNELQDLLRNVCSWLITSPTECTAIVNYADLNSSYSKVYPYLIELKNVTCESYQKEYCKFY